MTEEKSWNEYVKIQSRLTILLSSIYLDKLFSFLVSWLIECIKKRSIVHFHIDFNKCTYMLDEICNYFVNLRHNKVQLEEFSRLLNWKSNRNKSKKKVIFIMTQEKSWSEYIIRQNYLTSFLSFIYLDKLFYFLLLSIWMHKGKRILQFTMKSLFSYELFIWSYLSELKQNHKICNSTCMKSISMGFR